MTVLRQEQVITMDALIQAGRVSQRTAAAQLGVTEGALRYRRRRAASGAPDRRAEQATALDGFETAMAAALEALADTTRGDRPVSARLVYEYLVAEAGFRGSYPAVVRALRRQRGVPPVRAVRRVETPPGVQAQHDWFEERVWIGEELTRVYGLVGVLSHSRFTAVWVSRRMTQLAWQTGHAALFRAYGGVPAFVRVDNCKTAVARGAGPHAVLSPDFARFAQACGFTIDPCRVRTPTDKGKVERRIRWLHESAAALFRHRWPSLDALQVALDERIAGLQTRLRCPATGTSVATAHAAEQSALQPLPVGGEPFDVIVARRVARDSHVAFEGRQYSVPIAWIGRDVEVIGVARDVVIRGDGAEVARHPRHTAARTVTDPTHYDGPGTATVLPPAPLGQRGRAQVFAHRALPAPQAVQRPLDAYVALVEGRGR